MGSEEAGSAEEADLRPSPPPQAEGMISEIRSAFEETLGDLVWMDKKTRLAAKEKVSHGCGGGAILRWRQPIEFCWELRRKTLTLVSSGRCHL